jgi:phenylalanyl-tRNA synthetase beta chain
MSVDRTVMRRSMLVSAVECLAYNIRFAPRLATFEVGRVYLPEKSQDGIRPLEDRRVSILMTGPRRDVNLNPDAAGAEPIDFFDLKGVIETLLERLGVDSSKVRYVPHRQETTFTPRCARLLIGETEVGVFGELNPATLAQFGLKTDRVAAAELELAPLIHTEWDWSRQTTVNRFPAVIEDLAFVVDDSIGAGTLRDTLIRAGAGRVVDVELFDVFRGGHLGAGKKSLAYRVTYQDPQAALTNEQVVELRNTIVQAVAGTHNGILRAT